jgi:NADPH:quinone reductase-like Zn-dependent oxidoreductase
VWHSYALLPRKERAPGAFRSDLGEWLGRVAKGQLTPRVADRIPLDRAAEAHERLERGDVVGKLVLYCGQTATAPT